MSNDKPDYYAMAEGISKTIGKVTKPLTDAQFIALAGAVAVYVEKALAHEAEKQAGPVAGSARIDDAARALPGEVKALLRVLPGMSMYLHGHQHAAGVIANGIDGEVRSWAEALDGFASWLRRTLEAAPPSESDKDDAEFGFAEAFRATWKQQIGGAMNTVGRDLALRIAVDAIRAARAKKEQP